VDEAEAGEPVNPILNQGFPKSKKIIRPKENIFFTFEKFSDKVMA